MRQRELKKLKAIVAKLTFTQRRGLMDELGADAEAAVCSVTSAGIAAGLSTP